MVPESRFLGYGPAGTDKFEHTSLNMDTDGCKEILSHVLAGKSHP